MSKLGRNEPCHCGSTKKYKKCCLRKDEGCTYDEVTKTWAAPEKPKVITLTPEMVDKMLKQQKDSKEISIPTAQMAPVDKTEQGLGETTV